MSIQRIVTSVKEAKPELHPSRGTYNGPYLARARAVVSIERGAGESVCVDATYESDGSNGYDGYQAYHAALGRGLLLGTVPGYYSWEKVFEAETQERALIKARTWAGSVESKLSDELLARDVSLALWRRSMLEAGVPADLLVED